MFDEIIGFAKLRNIPSPHWVYACWETLGVKEYKMIQKKAQSLHLLKVNKHAELVVRDQRKQLPSNS